MRNFTAYIERDAETGFYFGIIPSVPGAYTQGETLEELQANLKEVLELCLEDMNEPVEDLPEFVGTMVVAV